MVAGPAAVAIVIGAVSILYAMAGQAGGTAFIAVMAITGFPAEEMRPTALLLNIVAAGFATWWLPRHRTAVDWQSVGPIILASLPAAFVGGMIVVGDRLYLTFSGLILILAAIALLARKWTQRDNKYQPIPILAAASIGAGVGLVSGLTGVGGGVFLAPALLLLRWASPEYVANLSAPFILANSLLGFAGTQIAGQPISSNILIYAIAALIGAAVGGSIRYRWMSDSSIRMVLALVLIIAGGRLVIAGST